MNFDADTPIYRQLMQLFRILIVSGAWPPGEKIPAVRDLAIQYSVNPNTVQRSLAELEREGLLYSERTAGRFVADDMEKIELTRSRLADEKIDGFIGEMHQLGYGEDKLIRLLKQKWSEKDEHD